MSGKGPVRAGWTKLTELGRRPERPIAAKEPLVRWRGRAKLSFKVQGGIGQARIEFLPAKPAYLPIQNDREGDQNCQQN
jgi:hypothetical protein